MSYASRNIGGGSGGDPLTTTSAGAGASSSLPSTRASPPSQDDEYDFEEDPQPRSMRTSQSRRFAAPPQAPPLRRGSSSSSATTGGPRSGLGSRGGSSASLLQGGAGGAGNSGSRARTGRRSSSGVTGADLNNGGANGGRRISMQPPKHPEMYDTEEQWREHHDNAEKTEGWHHLPLLLVMLPPLGAIIHGRAENWSDGIVITLICFYLYQLIKVPWDIYYASHARGVLDAALPKPGQEGYDPIQAERRDYSVKQLRRTELLSLLTTMIVPLAGSYLLYYARGLLSDPDRYINRFLISLFAIATSVKPFLHFAKLVKHHSLYHQEQVWYPSTEVHFLRRRVEALEKDLSQLTRAFATKDDVRNLRDGVDVPLSQLSKAVRRFDRKEEYLRLSSEERFALLEQKLEEAARERQLQQSLLDQLRIEAHNSNMVQQVLHALRVALLGSHDGATGAQRSLKWFERGPLFWVFLPINAPRLAIEYVSSGNEVTGWQEHKSVVGGLGPMYDDTRRLPAL